MTGSSLAFEITLNDGRIIVATPRPEDQDLLQAWTDRDIALTPAPTTRTRAGTLCRRTSRSTSRATR